LARAQSLEEIEAHADQERAIERLLADQDDFVAALAAHHALDAGLSALSRKARGAIDARPALDRFFPGLEQETSHAR
jgi:hypothetical protein